MPEDDSQNNKNEDEEKENSNKTKYLYYKSFKSFLIVLRDYYFLCMVKISWEKINFN